jgi:hypothetical protein
MRGAGPGGGARPSGAGGGRPAGRLADYSAGFDGHPLYGIVYR